MATLPSVHIDFSATLPLHVVIITQRLRIRSSQESDLADYLTLYGDPEVMKAYDTGETEAEDAVKKRLEKWVKRWREGDPYSGFAIIDKTTDEFIGHLVLGHGSVPGESEYACLFHKKAWKQGFATEAGEAIFEHYAPLTKAKGYTLGDKPLERIIALIRAENAASLGLLKKGAEKFYQEADRDGKNCFVFELKS